MKWLTLIAFAVLMNCSVGLAQQKQQPAKTEAATFEGVFLESDPKVSASNAQALLKKLSVIETQQPLEKLFVVFNGKMYMSLPGFSVLVPASGGGASGCFGNSNTQFIKA